jgi:hypothetical protein
MKTTIKWRAARPVYRAGIAIGTVVGLALATGAPMKWGFAVFPGSGSQW